MSRHARRLRRQGLEGQSGSAKRPRRPVASVACRPSPAPPPVIPTPPRRAVIGPEDTREHAMMAEAVHRAVCEFTKSDGFGHCYLYTLAGWSLLIHLEGQGTPYRMQAGSLFLRPDPSRPLDWVVSSAEDGGLERGEFHCWISSPDLTLIDFASHYFRRYVDGIMRIKEVTHQSEAGALFTLDDNPDPVRWNMPDPPRYIWEHVTELPEWVRYNGDPRALEQVNQRVRETMDETKSLRLRTCHLYHDLKGDL
jgi:hypothetical protein